jgi:hypothetical protein
MEEKGTDYLYREQTRSHSWFVLAEVFWAGYGLLAMGFLRLSSRAARLLQFDKSVVALSGFFYGADRYAEGVFAMQEL